MKNKYLELKRKHEIEINEFPMAFAFNKKQLAEGMKKLNVTKNSELLTIPGGGLIRKTDNDLFTDLFNKMNNESEEAMKDDDYVYQGFLYELGNHEFCITYDPEPTLSCFGLTVDEMKADERLHSIFTKARSKYLGSIVGW